MSVTNFEREHNNAVAIARLDERLERMEDDIRGVLEKIEKLHEDVGELTTASAKVSGGIFVVILIGGIIGWITQFTNLLVHLWPFH